MLHHQPAKLEMSDAELLMKRSGQLDANLETVNELEKTSARYHKVLTTCKIVFIAITLDHFVVKQ